MTSFARVFLLATGLTGLVGCGPTATTPVVTPVSPAIPAGPPPVAGAIAGALGASLSGEDRRIAADAQYDALEKGQRKSWKSKSGTAFGYVEPGSESGGCRDYTHTVYLEGRPKEEKGRGCREGGAGGWRL